MGTNISIFDTIIRIFIGMIFAGVFGAMGSIVAVLALYPIVTALTSFDPVYHWLGYTTCKEQIGEADKLIPNTTSDSADLIPEYRQSA